MNVGLPDDVPVYPFELLSFHVANTLPEEGNTPVPAGSDASNHNAHPEILRGV